MRSEEKVRKGLYLAMAIFVALGIWFFVDETTGPNGGARLRTMTISDIPIEYLYEDTTLADRGLMLLDGEESGTDTTIDLTLEGTRRLLVQLDRTKIRVTVDLGTITQPGMQTVRYNVSYTDRKFTDGIQVKDSSIYLATVNISELSRKDVEVRCELTGNVAEGFSAGQLQLSDTFIEIRGEESVIAPVSYAKVTLDIGKDAQESISQQLNYLFYDENDRLVDGTDIHTTVDTIGVSLPIYMTKELPLVLSFKESPGARLKNMVWNLDPKTITVSGDASILRNMDSIVLEEFDLLNVGADTTTHSYAIIVPDGCENLSGVTRATLEIAYPDKSVTTISTDRFRYENPPEGMELEILTSELEVTVFGTSADVAAITGEDIVVVVDLSNYSVGSGTYTVPAWIEFEGSQDIGISGEYQVQVLMRETNPEPDEPDGFNDETQTGEQA